VWQSIYLAIAAAAIILVFVPLSEKIFINIGHATDIVVEEIKYFKTLCYGAFFLSRLQLSRVFTPDAEKLM
jgi:hypothetical protein